MEVDYEPLTEGGSTDGLEPQCIFSRIGCRNGAGFRPPAPYRHPILEKMHSHQKRFKRSARLCRPTRDAEAVEEFLNSLDLYLRLQNAPEQFQLLLAPSLLEGDARRWWLHLSNGSTFPEHIRSMQAFRDVLRCRFIPTYASEQAMAELRKLKQGKLSIERYIEKYQSLVNRSPMVDAELHNNWFIAGLAPGVRQTVTGWATDREMRDGKVELADMMEYLRRMKKKNATSTALAEKKESGPGNNPDLEPMDIGAVNTKPHHLKSKTETLNGVPASSVVNRVTHFEIAGL
ncbi:uncharacterized protein EMH_0054110 [Eimeria mitis]|uniref:Retrotransposon gag domain-containing protein n=1 Tax=Eimeria mitis TaxID=44415 RepID=U6JX37_9EIME|nr:uncharacterized protein EMH_0054110 [Eimeria mitis]CDJ29969.1 hypothetical protein EMH_0054110 [Eimeria mitis]